MEKLDAIVVGEVVRQVLEPDRLAAMLDAYVQSAAAQADGAKAQLASSATITLRQRPGSPELLELVEKGLMEAEDPVRRERLVGLKLKRDQIAKEIGDLQNRMASSRRTITAEKVVRVGTLLRDRLYEGPPEFRQAYARLLMDEVRVTDEEIRISGSKSVLAKCAADGVTETAPKVLSFVQGWRAERDSNAMPPISSVEIPWGVDSEQTEGGRRAEPVDAGLPGGRLRRAAASVARIDRSPCSSGRSAARRRHRGAILAKGQTETGRVWVYGRDDRPFGAALFYASRDRTREHPERHLSGYVNPPR